MTQPNKKGPDQTMTSSVWDDPTIRPSGDYVKFETVGDFVVGEIIGLGIHEFPDGKRAAKLIIRDDDGEERTLTAGQVQLATKLAEARPEVGDRVKITFTQVEKRSGGKTLKHFDVAVKGTPKSPAEEF